MTSRASNGGLARPPRPSFPVGLGQSVKAIGKILLKSRRCPVERVDGSKPLIILGNGPSLADTIADNLELLKREPSMAVNFAANTPQFLEIKPRYYVLADPHFFSNSADSNVRRLTASLSKVDWPMTLFLPADAPASSLTAAINNPTVEITRYNALGVEGFRWLTDAMFRSGRAMPRPRNVLIPSIMLGLRMGYRQIYIVGADHSWTRTLDVDSENRVVSVQPHFYKEDEKERQRVTALYKTIPLHQMLESLTTAFRSYHVIADYANRAGYEIYNSTPQSFIDAFPRRPITDCEARD